MGSRSMGNTEVYEQLITHALANYAKEKYHHGHGRSDVQPDIDHTSIPNRASLDQTGNIDVERDAFQLLAADVLSSFHEKQFVNKMNINTTRPATRHKEEQVSLESSQQATPVAQPAQLEEHHRAGKQARSSSPGDPSLVINNNDTKPSTAAPAPVAHTTSIFPMKLHELLDDTSATTRSCITWMPDGKMWKVLDTVNLEGNVLNRYFRHCKYTSFNRQVNLWGFTRVIKSNNGTNGCYHHPLFIRGQREMCLKMKRKQEKHRSKLNNKGKIESNRSRVPSSPKEIQVAGPNINQPSRSLNRSESDDRSENLNLRLRDVQQLNQNRSNIVSNPVMSGYGSLLATTSPPENFQQNNQQYSYQDESMRLLSQAQALAHQHLHLTGIRSFPDRMDDVQYLNHLRDQLSILRTLHPDAQMVVSLLLQQQQQQQQQQLQREQYQNLSQQEQRQMLTMPSYIKSDLNTFQK